MTATVGQHENPVHRLAVIAPGPGPHLVVLSALARRAEGRSAHASPPPERRAPGSATEAVTDRLRI